MVSLSSYWDKQAATFDDEPDHGLRDMTVRSAWADLLAAHLPPAPASVADVGCGTGTLAVLLSAAGYGVCGCDSSAGMIEQARAKALTAGVDADGRLVLIEGHWSTGAGLKAEETLSLLADSGRATTATELTDAALWGGPISDERYLIVGDPR